VVTLKKSYRKRTIFRFLELDTNLFVKVGYLALTRRQRSDLWLVRPTTTVYTQR